MLPNMKIGKRGRVIKPKDLLRKKPRKLALARWMGRCKKSSEKLGYASVDEFIEDVRGR
jgi:hypothetical protein